MNTTHVSTQPRAPAGGGPRRSRVVLAVLLLVALIVPVTAASASTGTATVYVHFTPVGSECEATQRYPRTVETPRVLAGAIEQLLAGPTQAERAAGATSYLFNERTAGMLRSVNIRDGVAHIDFGDLRAVIPNASSSCGSTSLLTQLDATAEQFPTVQRARYSINGSEATFYNWLGRSVPDTSRVTVTRGSLSNQSRIEDLSGEQATLKKIRVGRHDGFDRVVLEFDGGVPGYSVHYAPVAQADGSGAPIPTPGTVALQVYLLAESVNSEPLGPEFTFEPTGPITPGYPTLRQVRYGGFFEGGTTFGVGLKGRSGFRVLELTGPPRLAIDVAHGVALRNLRSGDRGSDVRDWQHRLNVVQFGTFASSPGHAQGPLTADGVFGTKTVRATRTFQGEDGVTVTGVVDAATRNAMYQALRRSAQIRP